MENAPIGCSSARWLSCVREGEEHFLEEHKFLLERLRCHYLAKLAILLDSHSIGGYCDHALSPYLDHIQRLILAGKTARSSSQEGGALQSWPFLPADPAHHAHAERAKVFRNGRRGAAGRGFHRVASYSHICSPSVSAPFGWSSAKSRCLSRRHPTMIQFNQSPHTRVSDKAVQEGGRNGTLV